MTTTDTISKDEQEQTQEETMPEKIGIDVLDSFLEHVERVAFTDTTSRRIGLKAYYIRSIEHLLKVAKERGLDIGIKNQAPYVYNGRFWQRIEWETFRHFLQEVGAKQGIPYEFVKDYGFAEKLVKQFISAARFPVSTTTGTPKINLRNGTLHFAPSGIELKPFNKQDGLTYQLHYDCDKSAEAPQFRKFIERVLPNQAVRKLIFQYIGYVFLRKMKLEKILFFYGDGANGKSVLMDIIEALVGEEQCFKAQLEDITGDKYTRAQLGNYILNVCSEISNRLKTDIFKLLASREPLPARHPYGRPFKVTEYATCIFSMNNFPKDVEQTNAFFRRFLIVEFGITIPEEEADTELAKKIIATEMSGVLNYVIKGANSLLKNGKFDIPPEVAEAIKKLDNVFTYLKQYEYRPSRSNKHWITLDEMHKSYENYCDDDDSRAVSKRTFAKRLRDLGYVVEPHGHDKATVVLVKRAE
jgi:putative DNA primase/helicase